MHATNDCETAEAAHNVNIMILSDTATCSCWTQQPEVRVCKANCDHHHIMFDHDISPN